MVSVVSSFSYLILFNCVLSFLLSEPGYRFVNFYFKKNQLLEFPGGLAVKGLGAVPAMAWFTAVV